MFTRKSNYFLYFTTITINFLSLGCGTTFSWTSPVIPLLRIKDNPLGYAVSTSQESLITSLENLGAIFGPFLATLTVDRIGRKMSLQIFALPLLTSYIILAFAQTIELYYFARFLCGLGVGCAFAVVPMYVGEIAEDRNRGILGCFLEVFVTLGELFCILIGYFVNDIMVLSLGSSTPIVIFLVMSLFIVPESPYYYSIIEDKVKVLESLRKLRMSAGEIQKEFETVEKNVKDSVQLNRNFRDFFKSRDLQRSLFISIGLTICQQFCGITAINAFLEPIFNASSFDSAENSLNKLSPVMFTTLQVISCCFAAKFSDKLGRRVLLITSEIGMAISLGIFGFYLHFQPSSLYFIPLLSMLVYVVSFAFGSGPITWAMIGELFPPDMKALGGPIAATSVMVFAYAITAVFPFLWQQLGLAITMWIFAICCLLAAAFIATVVPETRGKSLSEIQIQLGKKSHEGSIQI